MVDFKNLNYDEIWKKRAIALEKIRANDSLYQSACIHYKNNPIDFIEDWGVTFDPRRVPALMPFILWPRQKEYIAWLKDLYDTQKDGLCEKSRDMGITWLNMAFSIWLWDFYSGRKISFGSRKETLVDRLGDPDSIIEKGRTFLRYLPEEFLPPEFNLDEHAPFMKIINPINESSIIGEVGKNIGRGGRSSIYFKDESAYYEQPEIIERAVSQNADCKIDVSTPNGTGNPFHRKRTGGKISVFTFHWRDDPRKDEAWYLEQKERYDAVTVAQEVDIDYSTSTENIVIPAAWVAAAINLKIPATGMKIAGLDVADEGGDDNALIRRHGVVVTDKNIDSWKEGNTTETTRKAYSLCEESGTDVLKYDSIGVGAGVKGEVWSLQKIKKKKIQAVGVNTGAAPTSGNFAPGKTNEDMFANLKAQLWWEMRRRFQRTFNFKNGETNIPHDQLISIPNHRQLVMELSQPKYGHKENGKIIIESKKSMKIRGIKSPNFADALIICFSREIGLNYNMLTSK